MPDSLCTLQYAAGRVELCPGASCPFWLAEGCVIAGAEPELHDRPSVVHHLLELRLALDHARVGRDARQVRSLFYRLLNDEQKADP